MEDAHIAEINLGDDTYLFGVFDGHGGIYITLFLGDKNQKKEKSNGIKQDKNMLLEK